MVSRNKVICAFVRAKRGLLDALVAAQPEARCDETFARVREELGRFHSIEPAAQPPDLWSPSRLSKTKAWVGCTSCSVSPSVAAWRTTWCGQDRAGTCAARIPPRAARRGRARRSVPGGRPEVARIQLEGGSGTLHSAAARARIIPAWSATAMTSPLTTWCSPPTARCAGTPGASRRRV